MSRKEKILEILREKKEVTVKELSNIFKVSEMTIYRDIKELEKEGEIKRKHGSVLLNTKENRETLTVDTCPICEKPITRSHPYKIIVENTKVIEACCEHCGLLLHQKYADKEVSAITYDFITENPISALNAFFVVGSSAVPCCSPSVIPFASREDAEKFQKGFGGKVMTFVEAYNEITNKMNINIKSCCAPQQNVTFKLDDLK
ncbi:MAG TPA: HTH domain-containing protein [Persephonella sp.]|uniref:YcnK n=1 Tax=Persephonella marina (strain DSM 14350 / EX-H1) TaxID=123214 RepID=C0QUG7_PERMH|nr:MULTISPECIES: DeoR family transcriptional regulator [Persephonella]ACO04680.1 YcnK [Persephonella marina EX-H1]HCB70049.1 HTH domain-containing protein [Persephonella sp.]